MSNNKWITMLSEKIKKIKHFDIILVVVLSIVILLVISGIGKDSSQTIVTQASTGDYATTLENRLGSALSNIHGAGSVDVMITLDGTSELVLAYTTDNKNNSTSNTTSNGTTSKTESNNTSTSPIIINTNGTSTPLVLTEILPKVKGVIVIAQGANDIRVKLDILKAVQALLGVSSSQVEIFVKG
ncbi:MAG: hypothetical protein IKC79_00840 [Clostridia bacterium]|nr:hypothetical protein [Clostridia bacterium]